MNKLQLKNKTFALTWLSFLIALQIILGRLNIGVSWLKVGLSFIVVALIGYYFGFAKSMIASMIADVVANVLFPPESGFFIGFTLSAIITGGIYGFMLHHKKITWQRLAITTTLTNILVNGGLNTLWISILGSSPFWTLFVLRIGKELVAIVMQTIILLVIFKWLQKHHYD